MKKVIITVGFIFVYFICSSQTIWLGKTNYQGTIGTYGIKMTLAIPYGGATSCFIIGEYYYTSQNKTINLCSPDGKKIIETVNGKETGYFIFDEDWNKKVGEKLSGTWYSSDGKTSYSVSLTVKSKVD